MVLGSMAVVPAAHGASTPERPSTGRLAPKLAAAADAAARGASVAEQNRAASVAEDGPGSLLRPDHGRVHANLRVVDTSDATLAVIERAGAEVLSVSAEHRTVTAAVPLGRLRHLAELDGVEYVEEILTPLTSGLTSAAGLASPSRAAGGVCAPIISEADTQLRAALARSTHGVDGTGVTVGVLSDSYDRNATDATSAAGDIATGDLPGAANPCGRLTPVNVLSDPPVSNPIDEGRAMAQLVHDLAPGAALSFHTAFVSQTDFAQGIIDLQVAGAQVIVDDVSYYEEPFFQDGLVSNAVNQVTAAGVTYFSSAGNSNIILGGNDVSSWEAPAFRPSGSCPFGLPSYATNCADFNPTATVDNSYSFTVAADGQLQLDLQWAEPWYGVATDLDAYLINTAGTVLDFSEGANVAGQRPFEFISWPNNTGTTQTVRLTINRYTGTGGGGTATPRLKFVLIGSSGVTSVEYPTSSGGDVVGPTIFGHNGAANAMSTAAVPFDNSAMPETYSSRGPVTLRFAPVSGTTPAAALPAPAVLAKPDLAATDGGQTTFFYGAGPTYRFYGTSAAAPHAAAVAALVLDKDPLATTAVVKTALRLSADPVGAFGSNAVGAGLVDALGAVEAVTVPTLTVTNKAITEPDGGTVAMKLRVTMSHPSAYTVKFKRQTVNGTATAPSDYLALALAQVSIKPGGVAKSISVTVNGDTDVEPNERFNLVISEPVRATIADASGQGTIRNDD
jgi:hypothetical protein